MPAGKTIKLFLLEGDPNGRMTCEVSNWTGKAYRIPRTKVKESIDRSDLKKPGVYFLFGKDEFSKDLVYVGEAEVVIKRIKEQLVEKEFWNESVAFISKDENLNKAHIKYLENKIHELAIQTQRYKVVNIDTPTASAISESDRAEMEEFLSNIRLLLNTLGHKVLKEIREEPVDRRSENTETVFFIKAARGAEAQGKPTSDGFVVFRNSKAAHQTVPTFPDAAQRLRDKLLQEGVLVVKTGESELTFAQDWLSGSPSTAAMIVMGRTANGRKDWKTVDGVSLRDYEAAD